MKNKICELLFIVLVALALLHSFPPATILIWLVIAILLIAIVVLIYFLLWLFLD